MSDHDQTRFDKSQTSNIPVPDPSVLTTENLRREVQSLKELINARLDGSERAFNTYVQNAQRAPTELDRQILMINNLIDEKFLAVGQQFRERDIRTDQDKVAASTAINAALSALKEMIALQNQANSAANTKSDAATTKQIEATQLQLQSMSKNTDDKITDIKGRMDRGEGSTSGNIQTSVAAARNMSVIVGVGGLIVAVLALFIAYNAHQVQQQYAQPPTIVSPAVVPLTPAR